MERWFLSSVARGPNTEVGRPSMRATGVWTAIHTIYKHLYQRMETQCGLLVIKMFEYPFIFWKEI